MIWAPVAQLDRASASGVEGRGFESRRVYHLSKIPVKNPKAAYASKLARRFFSFLHLSVASHPRDFFGGLPSLRSGTRLRLVESRRKLMQVNLHAAFFLFYISRVLRSRGIFFGLPLPPAASGSLRFARVESRQKVPSFKNPCKKT